MRARRNQINWRTFYPPSESRWVITHVMTRIVGLSGRHAILSPQDPKHKVYAMFDVCLKDPDRVKSMSPPQHQLNWCRILVDVERSVWSYVDGLTVCNHPPRYKFTTEHMRVLGEKSVTFFDEMVGS